MQASSFVPWLTISVGAALVVLGLIGYLATAGVSATALIPAFIGAPLALLGVFAQRTRWRTAALSVAGLLALIGFLGSLRGALALPALLSGETVARPAAVIAQSVMALLLLAYGSAALSSLLRSRRGLRAT